MFPVDAVFLWVDGNDPEHRISRTYWDAKEIGMKNDAGGDQRFMDHGELRYALRSMEKYAPWIRKIHIVTNGQIPEWLDVSHPKIHMVTHEEIFPDHSVLPTFNSHAIELFIDRIPGLAECFLFCNDDTLLSATTQPQTFFTEDGKARIFFSQCWLPEEGDPLHAVWQYAMLHTNMLLNKAFGSACRRRPVHQIRALHQSVCQECRVQFSDEITHTSRNRFRTRSDVIFPWCLASLYTLHVECGVPAYIAEAMVGVMDDPQRTKLALECIEKNNPTLLCINDKASTSAEESWNSVRQTLEGKFSDISSFEKSAALTGKLVSAIEP